MHVSGGLKKSVCVGTTLLLSGCMANPVNGYFQQLPSSSVSQSTSNGSGNGANSADHPGGDGTDTGTGTLGTDPLAGGGLPHGAPSGTPSPMPTTDPGIVAVPPVFVPNGILNGHFDVDTATGTLPFPIAAATVTFHVHEYDKVNQTTTVDFFNILNRSGTSVKGTKFDQLQATLTSSQRFYLIVVNAPLNPGGVLDINGTPVRATSYQNLTQQIISSGVMPPAYTLGAPLTAGDLQLNSMKMSFDSNTPADHLLVPTAPNNCVFTNIKGPKGEYRDGALVVQAVDAASIKLDPLTGAATANGGLLWEGIIYNHYMLINANTGAETDAHKCY
jgi:hypothetical protein